MATDTRAMVGGYWENWAAAINPKSGDSSTAAYYEQDIQSMTHNFYSFLTLAKAPNADSPPNEQWDGVGIYESMTGANVLDVMEVTDPIWDNGNNWQRVKIVALQQAARDNNAKFIWALGGWSDLTLTVSDSQIPALVDQLLQLLRNSGDGVDFDWEHLSSSAEVSVRSQQRKVLGSVLTSLRSALDANGMSAKSIGYTTRFNAFWATPPPGVQSFESDGEGIDVISSISDVAHTLSWVNIMMYDVPASSFHSSNNTWDMSDFQLVLQTFAAFVPKKSIVLGFEPGPQAADGVNPGNELSRQVIDYVHSSGYGGVMFWATNEHAADSTGVNGLNSQNLAKYARSVGL